MANNQNDLFNQFNPMTTTASSDLFAAPKDTTRDIYRQPSRYELQQRAAAQNEAVYNAALRDFQAVMEAPEWQNASLERRQEIYDDIKETQYQKFLSQYQDNEDLYYKLQMIPELTLGADISSLKKQIDDANELADTWRGMQTSAHQVATGLGDSVPMAVIKWQRDRLAGRTDAYAQRRIAELDEELARQVAEQAETLAKVKALDAQKSIARRNTELRREELQGENGEFLGSVGWALESPLDALSLAVEQTPTMVPVAAASAGGFLAAGPVGAGAAGAAMGSLLSGGDAAGGASMDLLQRPMEEFQKMPEFQELIKQGVSAETARNLIIAGAAGSAGLTGAAIGAATGVLGPGGMVGRTAGRLLTGTAARSAANSTITGAIGKGALKAAGGAGVEGVEEGATQWASNTGVNTATGLNEDVWEGVGEAAALGVIAGGPMSTVSSAVDTVQGIRAARAEKKAKAARGETDTTTHSDVVSPAEAAAAVSGDTSQASAPTTSEDSNKLRQALTAYRDKLYETPGIPLTVEERNSLYDVAYAATKAGVSESAVNSMLGKVAIKRATPDNVSLPDGFKAYAAARDAQTSATPATATATPTTTASAAIAPTRPSWAGAESMEHVAPLAQAMMSAYKRDSVVPQATYTPMQREPFDATVRSLPRTPRGLRVNTPETVYVRPDGKASASLSKLQGKGNGRKDGNGTATTGAGSTGAVAGVAAGDGAATGTRMGDDIAASARAESAGLSGGRGNTDTANAVYSESTGALGSGERTGTADTGRSDTTVPAASEAVSAGERGVAGETGQRATDGRGAESTGLHASGGDWSVGQKVVYRPRNGGKAREGVIAAINDDGTYDVDASVTRKGKSVTERKAKVKAKQLSVPETASVTEATPAAEVTTDPVVVEKAVVEAQVEALQASVNAVMADETLPPAAVADVAEVQQALDEGDVVAAAELAAEARVKHGISALTYDELTDGRRDELIAAFRSLPDADRTQIREEWESLRDIGYYDGSGNIYTFTADAVIADMNEQANAEVPTFWTKLSDGTKALIRKIRNALAAALVGITLWNAHPVTDVHAATTGVVTQVQPVQGLSSTASVVRAWVQETKDNQGQKYIIADKVAGELYIMDSRGNVLATMPALYGSRKGDAAVPGQTPAGIFMLQQRNDVGASLGGDVQQFAEHTDGSIWAIHRVLTTNPKQMREARLKSVTAADNRISLGCINVPADMYDKYLKNGFQGKLYVIPEQKPLGEVFRDIQENVAVNDLMPGAKLPASLDSTDTMAFRSSTDNLAAEELTTGKLDTGATLNVLLATTDPESLSAMKSNDAADLGAFAAIPAATEGIVRNARRRRNARLSESANDVEARETITGNQETPPVAAGGGNRRNDIPDSWASTAWGKQETPKERVQSLWFNRQRWMIPVVTKLYDTQYRFLRWIHDNVVVPVGVELTDNKLASALKRAPGIRDAILADWTKLVEPSLARVAEIAEQKGMSVDDATRETMTWITMRHIPEANAELRRQMEAEIDEAIAEDRPAAEVNKAVKALEDFDAYQRGEPVEKVATAGGWTSAQAMVTMRDIESRFSIEELESVAQPLYDALNVSVQARIKAGVLTQEQVDTWARFKYYVPLYIHQKSDGKNAFVGSSALNPLGEMKRHGATDGYAEHALMTVTESLNRAAASISIQPFKQHMNDMFVNADENHMVHGLMRVPVNEGTARGLRSKPGFYFTEHKEDGTTTKYKFVFYDEYPDGDAIMEGLFPPEKDLNPILAALATGTSAYARLLTKYRPTFAPVNWMREGAERAANIASRYITNEDGEVIGATDLQVSIRLAAANPAIVAALSNHLMTGGNTDNEYVKAYRELEALGGLSTFSNILKQTEQDIRKDLRKMKGVRKYAKEMDNVVGHWNEMFGAAPAVAAFMVLKSKGVSPERAAMFVLDSFNIHNHGTATQWLRSFQPFIVPAMEGSRNLIRSLSTKRGMAVTAGRIAVGIALYTMLAALAPDDEMDKMTITELSRAIPVFNKDGSFFKIPVAFGLPRVAWVTSAMLARSVREGGDFIADFSGATAALAEELMPLAGSYSGEHASNNPALAMFHAVMPELVRPFVEVATNASHFGTPIHIGNYREGERFASNSGKTMTAGVWKDAAATLRSTFGIDMYPESIRHIINAYGAGALSGLVNWLEKDSLYVTRGHMTTRQELGGFWTSVGITALYDNGNKLSERRYWRLQDKANDLLMKYGVERSHPDNQRGAKASSAMRRMLAAGASYDEARFIRLAIETDSQRSKNNRALNDKAKRLNRMNLSPDMLRSTFSQHLDKQNRLMERFIETSEGLNL
ncbi:LPD38 domain-containing protein [Escherichia coli]|uniref:LPD38 domain-containing protein n=1 Tax=Escherichia coli TaxID=562 RepID=UPI003BF8E621